MLNRRTLRIKAMQAIYAYTQAEGSNYGLALDQLEEAYQPDMDSMEPQDLKRLEGSRKLSQALFKEWFDTRNMDVEGQPKEIVQEVRQAIATYENRNKADQRYFGEQMLAGVEKIFDNYLRVLLLLQRYMELAQQERDDMEKRFVRGREDELVLTNFLENKVLRTLITNEKFRSLLLRRNISWDLQQDLIRTVYKNVVRNDEEFREYLTLNNPTYEDDRKLVLHLLKKAILKEETLQALFEEQDLNWPENEPIVKSLAQKTIKMFEPESKEDLPLLDLSTNWEEDRQFFDDLYKNTLVEWEQHEKLIAENVQNWDVERIALTDKIILKMALTEMIHFRSIPVKVTINEWIEISKLYSTPKSKQFVNGVLDKLSQELIEKGTIRKSGRGLLDNK